ncbi:MAG: class I SAM-dependent methyltransferase [Clostridia bacterium]|nr:class I SAM-dependent methyltransferase [Clostridia bacterium]
MIRLTDRLQVIANHIQKGEKVADIGTDHGYIPIYIYQKNISDKLILTDINKGPMEIAVRNLRQHHIPQNHYDARIGDGLKPVKTGEVDTIVIAGMGGLLIKDILSYDMNKTKALKKLILQPRNAQDKLREWLLSNGFEILDESLVIEGKFICEIIVAVPGEGQPTEQIYYEIGKKLIEKKDPLLESFITRKINVEKSILKTTSQNDSKRSQNQYQLSKERIKKLKEVLDYVRNH